MPLPRVAIRRSFSLRTLLVATAVVASWLGYHAHWIRERHAAQEWINSHATWATMLCIPDPDNRLPWALRLLGEPPLDESALLAPLENERLNPTSYLQRFAEIERLFPECTFVDMGDGSVYWPD